jgi:hypothetical protein
VNVSYNTTRYIERLQTKNEEETKTGSSVPCEVSIPPIPAAKPTIFRQRTRVLPLSNLEPIPRTAPRENYHLHLGRIVRIGDPRANANVVFDSRTRARAQCGRVGREERER